MRKPSIWESASRPMFVKSVWLETGHRHFILDYEPKRRLDSGAATMRFRREPLQASASCDFPQLDEELLLVGSSKAQYEQNFSHTKSTKSSTGNYRRFSSRKMILDHFRRRYDFLREDAQSKRSSTIDINSVMTNNSQSDEKLAERVLNWLDLAGKTPLLRPAQQSRPETDRKKIKKERGAQKIQESVCSRGPDSVKHITIIFNKEGVPVRLNRPARNIDLCALSSSAVTVRRLAGNLASARLYEGGISAEAKTNEAGNASRPRPKTTSSRKTIAYDGFAKKKGSAERDSLTVRDPKRQLHIFMPSLPKKTPLSDEAISTDLSNQCKINSA